MLLTRLTCTHFNHTLGESNIASVTFKCPTVQKSVYEQSLAGMVLGQIFFYKWMMKTFGGYQRNLVKVWKRRVYYIKNRAVQHAQGQDNGGILCQSPEGQT